MKWMPFPVVLLGATISLSAQTSFRADLVSGQSPGITGAAGFVVEELNVRFTISLASEDLVPTNAQIAGPHGTLMFELGPPHVAVHSPGPWPNGYDGSTSFFGTFQITPELLIDLRAGQAFLQLMGTQAGDFNGRIVPTSSPSISRFNRQGSNMEIGFRAEPPFEYRVERSSTVGMNGSVGFTNITALSQTLDVVVKDSAAAPTGFYRLRRELCR